MGNSSAKYAPPQEDGGYATLADTSVSGHPPAAPSVGTVSVSRSHNWSTKLPSASVEYGDDEGALTADNVDKAPSHRSAVTRPRYSSVSSSAKQPDEPYETRQTYVLTDNLNKIKRVGHDVEDIGEPSTAQKKQKSRTADDIQPHDQQQLGAKSYVLQSKKASHHAAMLVRPGSGLVGLQPGALTVDDKPSADGAPPSNVRRLKPLQVPLKYR
ncbi:hypothetical protein H257_03335 [Aphanomyces astaci]|uniref:Uncharacterized protein n=1 Tax=Aphanomyces astaci TaxID=112090 RepID=W4GYF5_APHAT|nr:hypothetical protein H257_03335 [Aphanomyces astaci]ETV83958.1 hypothetical protein H257_03335 [Aphanomyces astaci]|eukprot:XP_009825650.1 hypothetical protein H257_03335 [Aphanomyces astaci]